MPSLSIHCLDCLSTAHAVLPQAAEGDKACSSGSVSTMRRVPVLRFGATFTVAVAVTSPLEAPGSIKQQVIRRHSYKPLSTLAL